MGILLFLFGKFQSMTDLIQNLWTIFFFPCFIGSNFHPKIYDLRTVVTVTIFVDQMNLDAYIRYSNTENILMLVILFYFMFLSFLICMIVNYYWTVAHNMRYN